jgi:hypothetical protein
MIVYQLLCENGHEFEGWFQSGAAFDEQAAAGIVECPHCASCHVSKAIMSPNVATKGAITSGSSSGAEEKREVFRAKVEAMATEFRDQVEKNCDYVGDEFPEEARKIHYGERDERGIYGEASVEETKELIEEGITVFPMPSKAKTKKKKKN